MNTSRLTAVASVLRRSLARRTMLGYTVGAGMAAAATALAGQLSSVMGALRSPEPDDVAAPHATSDGGHAAAGKAGVDPGMAAETTRDVSLSRSTPGAAVHALSGIRGVAMAVEWAADGTLVAFASPAGLSRDLAVDAARYGAALSAIAPGLADAYSRETGLAWAPFHTFVASGGEWAAVVGKDNLGVWVKADDANLNDLAAVLNPPHR